MERCRDAGDRARLRDWRKTFIDALAAARNSGHSAEIASEGALLDPDAALGGRQLPNGIYRCRVIKLGAKSRRHARLCRLSGLLLPRQRRARAQRLEKLAGSQRYVGLIFPNDAMRRVFLGTLVLGDENRAMQYGRGPETATSPALSSASATIAGG